MGAWFARARKRALEKLKDDWAFLMWTGTSKPTLGDKLVNWWSLAATFIPLIAFPVVWYVTRTRVQGTVSAAGHLMGTWTAEAKSCRRDDDGARAVDILAGDDEVLEVVDGALTGLSVFVAEGRTSKKLRRWDSESCQLLKGSVRLDDASSTNGVTPADGSIDFDCTATVDGSREHVTGHLKFQNCS